MNNVGQTSFRISGYISRALDRKSDAVQSLVKKINSSTDQAFKDVKNLYQRFNQSKGKSDTGKSSEALAKAIVKLAAQEAGLYGNIHQKTQNIANAILINFMGNKQKNMLSHHLNKELNIAENNQIIKQLQGEEIAQRLVSFQDQLKELRKEISEESLLPVLNEKCASLRAEITELKQDPTYKTLEETKSRCEKLNTSLKERYDATCAFNLRGANTALYYQEIAARPIMKKIAEKEKMIEKSDPKKLVSEAKFLISEAQRLSLDIDLRDLQKLTAENLTEF